MLTHYFFGQADLYSASVFTARFNKKGFRPLKVDGRKKPLKVVVDL
jgi:hypothetical protein